MPGHGGTYKPGPFLRALSDWDEEIADTRPEIFVLDVKKPFPSNFIALTTAFHLLL